MSLSCGERSRVALRATPARDWLIGYLTTCGISEEVLDPAAAYDD
jgi:hypothetical protein